MTLTIRFRGKLIVGAAMPLLVGVAVLIGLVATAAAATRPRQQQSQLWYKVKVAGTDVYQGGGTDSLGRRSEDEWTVGWRAQSNASILFRYPTSPAQGTRRRGTAPPSEFVIEIGLGGETTNSTAQRLIDDGPFFGAGTTCNVGFSEETQTQPAKLYGYVHLDIDADPSNSEASVNVDPLTTGQSHLIQNEMACVNGDTRSVIRPAVDEIVNTTPLPAKYSKSKTDSSYTQTISGRVGYDKPFLISVSCSHAIASRDGYVSNLRQTYHAVFTPCPRQGLDVKHC
jgi:hypothetical protein